MEVPEPLLVAGVMALLAGGGYTIIRRNGRKANCGTCREHSDVNGRVIALETMQPVILKTLEDVKRDVALILERMPK
jgi:hypothetical protein